VTEKLRADSRPAVLVHYWRLKGMTVDDAVMDIRDAVQSFVDDAAIRASNGLDRLVHPFTKYSNEPVLQKTEPYEGMSLGPVSVIWDEKQSLWRMWYVSSGFNHPGMAGCKS